MLCLRTRSLICSIPSSPSVVPCDSLLPLITPTLLGAGPDAILGMEWSQIGIFPRGRVCTSLFQVVDALILQWLVNRCGMMVLPTLIWLGCCSEAVILLPLCGELR